MRGPGNPGVNTERRRSMRLTLAALALPLAAACGASSGAGGPAETRSQGAKPLDALAIELRVPETVASGDELPTTMVVENPSDHAITDPGCEVSSYRYGLVPEDEPDSDLWQGVTVACEAPFTMEPGTRRNSMCRRSSRQLATACPSIRVSMSRPSSGLLGCLSGLPIRSP